METWKVFIWNAIDFSWRNLFLYAQLQANFKKSILNLLNSQILQLLYIFLRMLTEDRLLSQHNL